MARADLSDEMDRQLRIAAFSFLEQATSRAGEVLDWSVLTTGFVFEGRTVPLIGASGIWKPALLDVPISITTAPATPGRVAPYADEVRADGLLIYRYRGQDPAHPHNVGLRRAFHEQRPLVYFHGVDKGRYRPFWPVLIAEDQPNLLSIAVELYDSATSSVDLSQPFDAEGIPERSYARRLTLQRLHQAGFRERVLRAYRRCCAVCQLKHAELLDAAHILPDRHPSSVPVVANGLSLCKIHHAAFDHHILGVRPDGVIEIRHDILDEVDGPMLRHGLQEVHGQPLIVPRRPEDRPNVEFLTERYDEFRRAG